MYRPTLRLWAVGRTDLPESYRRAVLTEVFEGLVRVCEINLRAFPDTPWLFESGVKYDRQQPDRRSACGDDDWQDNKCLYEAKLGDCDDLVAARIAELRVRLGVAATVWFDLYESKKPDGTPVHTYHVLVEWPKRLPPGIGYPSSVTSINGRYLEDPSDLLGMK